MDGENNGKPYYEQMDDLGGKPTIFGNIHMYIYISHIILNFRGVFQLPAEELQHKDIGFQHRLSMVLSHSRCQPTMTPSAWLELAFHEHLSL